MKININDYVKIKLTDYGKEVLKETKEEFLTSFNKRYNTKHTVDSFFEKIEYDKEGYTKFQLWHLMEIFGDYMYNGADNVFDLNIKLTKWEE